MSVRQVADSIKAGGGSGAWVSDGEVTAFDVGRGTVSVTIQPQGIEVDGLPYFTPLTTGPWKWIALPGIGATVKITSSDPTAINADTAYVTGAQWDEDDTPPTGYEAGDFLLVHKTAPGKLLLKADGSIELYGNDIKLGSSSAVELCTKAVRDWLNGDQNSWLATHLHTDPLSGSTGPPVAPPPSLSGGITTKVKAT